MKSIKEKLMEFLEKNDLLFGTFNDVNSALIANFIANECGINVEDILVSKTDKSFTFLADGKTISIAL